MGTAYVENKELMTGLMRVLVSSEYMKYIVSLWSTSAYIVNRSWFPKHSPRSVWGRFLETLGMIICIFHSISAMVNINMTYFGDILFLRSSMKQYYSNMTFMSQVRVRHVRKYLLPNTAEVLKFANNLQFKNIFRMNKVISVITSLSLSQADTLFRRSERSISSVQKLCLGIWFTSEAHMLGTTAQGLGSQWLSFDGSINCPLNLYTSYFQALRTEAR